MPDPVEGAPAPVPTDPAQPQKPLPQFVDDPFNADPARVREAPPAPEPPKKAELVDTLNTVQGILEALIPPEGDVVMTDTAGNKYRLRRSLPAAVETKILRRVEALANLSEDVAGPEFGLRFRAVLAGGAPATVLMNVVRLLSASDVLLGTLSECAAMAHPQVLAGARREDGAARARDRRARGEVVTRRARDPWDEFRSTMCREARRVAFRSLPVRCGRVTRGDTISTRGPRGV